MATTNELRKQAEEIVRQHPKGCPCGDLDCPQHIADLIGEIYESDRYIARYISAHEPDD